MVKQLYIVRHCKAQGQESEAALTVEGQAEALALRSFFQQKRVDRIISSPFKRAIQSIEPLAAERGVAIEEDHRLKERELSDRPLSDWLEKLERTYSDKNLAYSGGESSHAATERAKAVIDERMQQDEEAVLLVTHGNLMSLILGEYIENFGFEEWKKLSNPDVYRINIESRSAERIWKEGE